MQNYDPNLGELHSVYRPSKPRFWSMLALGIPLLMIAALCAVLIFDSFTGVFTGGETGPPRNVSNYFICLGIMGLLLTLLGSILISDYRAWSATRNVKLTVHHDGLIYESRGRIEACRWDEIEKVKSKFVVVQSKAFRTRVKVIQSIVKKDGAVIDLAETLDLRQISGIITAAMNNAKR